MSGVIIFTSIAFSISIILSITNYYLNREVEKIEKVLSLLPGYNCGACGFNGCHDMASNIINNGTDPRRCKKLNDEEYIVIEKYVNRYKLRK
ncbi:MAG: (Fe-S)-binding protein [Bacilli bacterium]|jgi:electron transport complex protein RnfB